tara:strand:- start:65 stop:574 length:510 start_codon:yes stop_codon:yes gene_type:complete
LSRKIEKLGLDKSKIISYIIFMKKKKKDKKAEILVLKKQIKENLNGWQRCKADFLNFKAQQEKLLPLFAKHANEELVVSILPVLDSCDLAQKHSKDKETAKQIKQQILGILKNHGLDEITANRKFDPNLHESVGQVKSDKKAGEIAQVIQKGYKMHDKIIRATKVKINN